MSSIKILTSHQIDSIYVLVVQFKLLAEFFSHVSSNASYFIINFKTNAIFTTTYF